MNTALESVSQPNSDTVEPSPLLVTLSTGQQLDISRLDVRALEHLQWREERAYAAMIARSARGSIDRAALYRQGYDTVTTIYGRIADRAGEGLVMGYDPRYAALVLELLAGREKPRVFEIGYGCGALLAALPGVDVAGIEVSATMRRQACRRLGPEHHPRLYLGSFLAHDLSAEAGCDLVYWNDVLEHLVPDEVPDFLRRIHALLAPGGYLVTITPNWHMRPSDITLDFYPPRTAAVGFHLKEYSLREIRAALRRAGFESVATPLLVTRGRIVLAGSGMAAAKGALEPLLEWVPFRMARLLCRGLGLSCTIARRPIA